MPTTTITSFSVRFRVLRRHNKPLRRGGNHHQQSSDGTTVGVPIRPKHKIPGLITIMQDRQQDRMPVVLFLEDLGFDRETVGQVASRCPEIFAASIEKTLKKKIEFLDRIGVSKGHLPRVIKKYPELLVSDVNRTILPRNGAHLPRSLTKKKKKKPSKSITNEGETGGSFADSPASFEPATSRRRAGGHKRKANPLSNSLSSPLPSKQLTREKAGISNLSIHNGPLTRARQIPNILASLAPSAGVKIEQKVVAAVPDAAAVVEEERRSRVEELQAEIEVELEVIRSRDSNAHVVPSHFGKWWKFNKMRKDRKSMC
uniref:Mitochondrial transcription termination factor family protein n=1 Tax=Populus alba TaxID=43335 RepID=A0A4V6A2B3_POPAL|nr:hypothetical protein D5086_0000282080 [Populus alba]